MGIRPIRNKIYSYDRHKNNRQVDYWNTKFLNSGVNIIIWLCDYVIILSDILRSINVTCYFRFNHRDYICIWDGYVKNNICLFFFWTLIGKCHKARDCICIPRKSVNGIGNIWKTFVTQRSLSKTWIWDVR